MSNLKRRRDNLMKTHPFCHWCGCGVVYFRLADGEAMPPNFATIDHMNTRLRYPDGRPEIGEQVLSCNACNGARNRAEESETPLEELWERSKCHKSKSSYLVGATRGAE